MANFLKSPFGSRIEVYTAYKASLIDEMRDELAPVLRDFISQLSATTAKLQQSRGPVVEISEALKFLLDPAAYSQIFSRPSPPLDFVDEVKAVLTLYERNTGLVPVDMDVRWDVSTSQEAELVCVISFTCRPWQSHYSMLAGASASLLIEVAFDDDDGIFDVRLRGAKYLELSDLLMLHAAFLDFGPGLLTWSWLRRPS